jgi:hypothetical protein
MGVEVDARSASTPRGGRPKRPPETYVRYVKGKGRGGVLFGEAVRSQGTNWGVVRGRWVKIVLCVTDR